MGNQRAPIRQVGRPRSCPGQGKVPDVHGRIFPDRHAGALLVPLGQDFVVRFADVLGGYRHADPRINVNCGRGGGRTVSVHAHGLARKLLADRFDHLIGQRYHPVARRTELFARVALAPNRSVVRSHGHHIQFRFLPELGENTFRELRAQLRVGDAEIAPPRARAIDQGVVLRVLLEQRHFFPHEPAIGAVAGRHVDGIGHAVAPLPLLRERPETPIPAFVVDERPGQIIRPLVEVGGDAQLRDFRDHFPVASREEPPATEVFQQPVNRVLGRQVGRADEQQALAHDAHDVMFAVGGCHEGEGGVQLQLGKLFGRAHHHRRSVRQFL